jgi:DNA mismatch repair ATPase MutS
MAAAAAVQQEAVTSMQDAYFLNTVGSSAVVKNDITLDKKLIITGPNAAGKTTIIKTTLFNVLLSQQLGYGVYKTATIVPYHFLHCYLNIPDTSGRDSLFQAESRRCKEILDCITEHASKRHFGIFDELYSGTNPYEAVASAYGYIDHISGMKNVDFMLTTHYIRLCELFRSSVSKKSKKPKKSKQEQGNPNIRNLHMKTTVGESGIDHVYHYKVVHGISKVRGGIKVLVDLKYPDNIIQTTQRIIDTKK